MNKIFKNIVWLVIAAPLVYLAAIWSSLPETVAVHFNIKGMPDRYGNKNELLLIAVILTILNAGIYLLLTNAYRIDPKKSAVENKARLQRIAFVVSVFMAVVLTIIIYSTIHVNTKFGVRLIFAGIGVLFCFVGNYIHTIRPNYFAGLRMRWTLESEDNWRKTHLLAGKLFFAGGLVIVLFCLFLPPIASFVIILAIMLGIAIASGVYSYRLYKQEQLK